VRRGEPENHLKRGLSEGAPVVAESELVEIAVDVLAPKPMEGSHSQRRARRFGQFDVARWPSCDTTDRLARMVLFLAAEDSRLCTAQNFVVDAGWA
jgi:hypothetical protein